ncbi:S41 family peptidase [Flavobacterium cerinum]|uniref:Peptidase S41 n=1 Tax=Flavobacterium cerinum TaxID=2502784 RepID=A0A444GLU2_9FLAO|nr:S41 family peptidase [Flavobacterium cerinum]RWW91948.1 peptidase S41 [Flavobacterium cerinum]
MKQFQAIILLIFSVFALISCQSDDTVPIFEKGTNEYVNQWMYDQMKKYYYWNDNIKGKGDISLSPEEFFSELLSPEDRFSYAYHPSLPQTISQSIRRSFGFEMGFTMYDGQAYGVVLYVLAGSPAKNYGLQRGQLVTQINNVAVNQANYEELYHSLEGASSANLTIINYSTETGFTLPKEINLMSFLTFGQPLNKNIFLMENKRIGYLEIPHFDVGMAQQFAQQFTEFKNQSCTEIILDLRYNGGGDISSAAALCILLAPNINANDFFIRFEGNKNGGTIDQSFKETLEMNESAVSYDILRMQRPNISKIYILCGNHTASASEIIINNLKPYMEVITIGEKTVGKNMAGFAITDDRNPEEQSWNLYPCIYKLYNANFDGGYNKGIEPVFHLNELEQLKVYALGDERELLINKAISIMTGNMDRNREQYLPTRPLRNPVVECNESILLPRTITDLKN